MRSLCTVQKIKELSPIEGKDRIVYASFENTGWHVIVGKDEFNIGDLCVYVEYDTILPVKPEFEFLRKRCFVESWNGFRIKNMKMANLFSEGLALPLGILGDNAENAKEGQDVTDAIGAIKYDPESREEGKHEQKRQHGKFVSFLLRFKFIKDFLYPPHKTSSFPKFVGKTDETRVQNLQYVFEKARGETVYITEKLDGQSATYAWFKNHFYVCSRNLCLPNEKSDSNHWKVAKEYSLKDRMRKVRKTLGFDFAIQGEIVGTGIQKNKYGIDGLRLYLFNSYNINEGKYLDYLTTNKLAKVHLGVETVPFLDIKEFDWKDVDELVEYSKGMSKLKPDVEREGIVVRTDKPKSPDSGMSNMWSFKVINPDFLVKHNL